MDNNFQITNVDETDGTLMYVGLTNEGGTWMIQKISDTQTLYAMPNNNQGITSYADSWAARLELTYSTYDKAI